MMQGGRRCHDPSASRARGKRYFAIRTQPALSHPCATGPRNGSPPVLPLHRVQADHCGVGVRGEAETDLVDDLIGRLAVGLAHRFAVKGDLKKAATFADDRDVHVLAEPGAGNGQLSGCRSVLHRSCRTALGYEGVLDGAPGPVAERGLVMAAASRRRNSGYGQSKEHSDSH